jgi:hypothetical protein
VQEWLSENGTMTQVCARHGIPRLPPTGPAFLGGARSVSLSLLRRRQVSFRQAEGEQAFEARKDSGSRS